VLASCRVQLRNFFIPYVNRERLFSFYTVENDVDETHGLAPPTKPLSQTGVLLPEGFSTNPDFCHLCYVIIDLVLLKVIWSTD
jgi:hypothetical protein